MREKIAGIWAEIRSDFGPLGDRETFEFFGPRLGARSSRRTPQVKSRLRLQNEWTINTGAPRPTRRRRKSLLKGNSIMSDERLLGRIELWDENPNIYYRVAHKSEETIFHSSPIYTFDEWKKHLKGVYASDCFEWIIHFGDYLIQDGSNNPDDYHILVIEGQYLCHPIVDDTNELYIQPIRIIEVLDISIIQ